MLSARELADAIGQLEQFREESDRHSQAQNDILQKYSALLEDYKRLQSDHEEARLARDNYKQLVRGQDRDPFVLVLVDGDGYIFDDPLVSNGAEGGSNAATLLNEAVKLRLRHLGLEHCRVMVRIYANLVGLSKALAHAKLCGAEKRSLAPFVANFNRSGDLFDFVDAGELKENADFKIRAVFRQFVESAQCKHIFFAACHDVGYVAELQPYMGNRHRITLLRNYATHREFSKLNLSSEDLPGVFRATPLPGDRVSNGEVVKDSTPPSYEPLVPVKQTKTPSSMPTLSADKGDKSKSIVCTFYQKSQCKHGLNCKFKHVKESASPAKSHVPAKFQTSNLAKSDHNFMTGKATTAASSEVASSAESTDFAALLPREEDLLPDQIAFNQDWHRLDPYTPPASREERMEFDNRIAQQKLCNNFHLSGFCAKGDACPFDHSAISTKVLECLKFVARHQPCPKRGNCLSATCALGHICQRPDCGHRGGKAYCKIPYNSHGADLRVAHIVQGVGYKSGTNASPEDNDSPKEDGTLEAESESDEDRRRHGAVV